ncbi:hypothetical protein ABEF92_008776 [Exophiala dermatitidis]|uniref:Uncharacterized protein n=1 Tax=Exophiala dermatitidis (strain ATCC 34100 / CBS 525.76 / NIH/UT8656) TaxID=858893 RepID=H6BT74_EXODN|nr:uncharacterized protein HMPREF1120_02493 [Exophiala dermatitidis NIH/UT8656]EHY54323.1 hypothetical protein HMPREF1120_02493 [Exophiala dermatitidis NIH/UT8656]
MFTSIGLAVLLMLLFTSLVRATAQDDCGTNQNPYCAGNSLLESLCCPYPNVCYWQNRDGAPGCCPQGQVCNGQPYNAPTTWHATTIVATTTEKSKSTSTHHASTVTSFVPAGGGGGVVITPTTQPSIVTVTSDNNKASQVESKVSSGVASVYSTVTSAVIGVYSTVTSNIGQGFATVSGVLVSGAPQTMVVSIVLPSVVALCILVWNTAG